MRSIERQRFNQKKRAAIKIQVIWEGILFFGSFIGGGFACVCLVFFPSRFMYLFFYNVIIFTGVSGICSISLAAFSDS
mgnify:CR=1 FL=1